MAKEMRGKKLVRIPKDAEVPLIGLVQIGIIDRGTNTLQIRPTTVCNLSCPFCSTDAGPNSNYRICEYVVEPWYLVEWLKEVVKVKKCKVHAFVDSVGEPFTHPKLLDLLQQIKEIKEVATLAVETNGTFLTREKLRELEEVGVDRINVSVHALNQEKARELAGCESYDLSRVVEAVEFAWKDTCLEAIVTPVWIPGVNDDEIPKIIEWAKRNCTNRKWPCLGIQKYEVHKFGRKMPGVKPLTWRVFYKKLGEWEREFSVKLKLSPADFQTRKVRSVPQVFRLGEKVRVTLACEGWMEGEAIGVARDRSVTLVDFHGEVRKGDVVKARIVRTKHSIYIARVLR